MLVMARKHLLDCITIHGEYEGSILKKSTA